MQVIKPIILGMLGGLALAMALVVGLYVSPAREAVYFAADPEMADIRDKLSQYQEWLSQTDLRIAENEPVADSLRNAQAKAWKDYKGWRNRMGELARAHAKPTAEGFWTWTWSLRFWILPAAVLLALLPAFLFGWRARSRFRAGRVGPVKGKPKTARSQALSNFEDAIKRVASISDAQRASAQERAPGPVARRSENQEPPTEPFQPPTAAIPVSDYSEPDEGADTLIDTSRSREPETVPLPLDPDAPEGGDTGLETRFLQVGPGWGEPETVAGERIGGPSAGAPATPGSRLSMEDEDGADDGEETLGVMPPTTEVERVERRKEEVLRLARKGMTSSEISRRMRISQDQVEFIIRLRREKG
jgi:hypothetical protein